MNIDDVKRDEIQIPQRDMVMFTIFDKQRQLFEKYFEIERRNGFYKPEVKFDGENIPQVRPAIDDAQFQHWLKDMFWRVTEEIAEALEPIITCTGITMRWKAQWGSYAHIRHFFEELADALHFLTEASLIVGIRPLEVEHVWREVQIEVERHMVGYEYISTLVIQQRAIRVIVSMGLAANCLKNKPWKLTQMETDEAKFKVLLGEAWKAFAALMASCFCGLDDTYVLYFQKHQVNLFRQNTQY